jgi:hypothetical protein
VKKESAKHHNPVTTQTLLKIYRNNPGT